MATEKVFPLSEERLRSVIFEISQNAQSLYWEDISRQSKGGRRKKFTIRFANAIMTTPQLIYISIYSATIRNYEILAERISATNIQRAFGTTETHDPLQVVLIDHETSLTRAFPNTYFRQLPWPGEEFRQDNPKNWLIVPDSTIERIVETAEDFSYFQPEKGPWRVNFTSLPKVARNL